MSEVRINEEVQRTNIYIYILQIHNDRPRNSRNYPHPSDEFDKADSLMLSLLALTCQGLLEVNEHDK